MKLPKKFKYIDKEILEMKKTEKGRGIIDFTSGWNMAIEKVKSSAKQKRLNHIRSERKNNETIHNI